MMTLKPPNSGSSLMWVPVLFSSAPSQQSLQCATIDVIFMHHLTMLTWSLIPLTHFLTAPSGP